MMDGMNKYVSSKVIRNHFWICLDRDKIVLHTNGPNVDCWPDGSVCPV